MMQRYWPYIYGALAISVAVGGFINIQPAKVANTNVDWIFISLSLLLGLGFPSASMLYAKRRKKVVLFQRPSFDRKSFGWWNDTLQPIRMMVIGLSVDLLGSLCAIPYLDEKGEMILFWKIAMTLGFFLGERIVYIVFKDNIAPANTNRIA